MHRSIVLSLALLLLPSVALPLNAQESTVRVATYNVLNFSGNPEANSYARIGDLRIVLEGIDPDLLLVQEMLSDEGATLFLDSVLMFNESMRLAPGSNLDSTDVVLYYDERDVEFLESFIHDTELRDIMEYVIVVRATSDTIHLFNAHLKAGNSTEDAEQRAREAGTIRRTAAGIPYTRHYIFGGDLNVYSSGEGAYHSLTYIGGLTGELIDPIERPGEWHSNEQFTDIHTQSPRTRQFGGGVHGGLDDRFDFILISPSLWSMLVPLSYTTYGNDGQHYNDSINSRPNLAVDERTADALHYGSDHLPVFADFNLRPIFTGTDAVTRDSPAGISVSPIPAHDRLVVRGVDAGDRSLTVTLVNSAGNEVRSTTTEGSGTTRTIDLQGIPSGLYRLVVTDGSGVRRTVVVPVIR